MVWQDVVIMFAVIVMSYALIPQVYYGFVKKKRTVVFQTAFLTFVGLVVLSYVYFTLGLFLSGMISSVTAFLWFLLLLQNILYK
jgi:hypothetical protein